MKLFLQITKIKGRKVRKQARKRGIHKEINKACTKLINAREEELGKTNPTHNLTSCHFHPSIFPPIYPAQPPINTGQPTNHPPKPLLHPSTPHPFPPGYQSSTFPPSPPPFVGRARHGVPTRLNYNLRHFLVFISPGLRNFPADFLFHRHYSPSPFPLPPSTLPPPLPSFPLRSSQHMKEERIDENRKVERM